MSETTLSDRAARLNALADWSDILGMDWLREVRQAPEMTFSLLGQRERGENLREMAKHLRNYAATLAAQTTQPTVR